tara:strand:+ start:170 stop:385 length:216 start_codon:yes stop_codon:yes gene_type:complete
MTTALFHGFDVPTFAQIQQMRGLLKPGDTTSEQAKTVDMLEDLIYAPGSENEGPKKWCEVSSVCNAAQRAV